MPISPDTIKPPSPQEKLRELLAQKVRIRGKKEMPVAAYLATLLPNSKNFDLPAAARAVAERYAADCPFLEEFRSIPNASAIDVLFNNKNVTGFRALIKEISDEPTYAHGAAGENGCALGSNKQDQIYGLENIGQKYAALIEMLWNIAETGNPFGSQPARATIIEYQKDAERFLKTTALQIFPAIIKEEERRLKQLEKPYEKNKLVRYYARQEVEKNLERDYPEVFELKADTDAYEQALGGLVASMIQKIKHAPDAFANEVHRELTKQQDACRQTLELLHGFSIEIGDVIQQYSRMTGMAGTPSTF